MLSRRDLLKYGALAAILGPVALSSDLPLGLSPPPLHKRTFQPLVGDLFEIAKGDARVNARLVELVTVDPAKLGGEAFKLVFEAGAGTRLGQDTYRLRSTRLGEVHLFLVPGSSAAGSQHYEALINRLP